MPHEVLSVPAAELKERLNRAESRGFRVVTCYPNPDVPGETVVVAWRRAARPEDRPPNCPKCGATVAWAPDPSVPGGHLMIDPATVSEHDCNRNRR